MRAVERTEADVPTVSVKTSGKTYQFFQEFLNSDSTLQEILPDEGEKLEGIRTSLAGFADRHELPVRLFSRSGRLFMEKGAADVIAQERAERAAKRAAKAEAKANEQAA